MKFMLGKKIGMSQIFQPDGTLVGVTLLQAGPVTVTRLRTKANDGYEAVQIGYEETAKRKTQSGKYKAKKEFRNKSYVPGSIFGGIKLGDVIDVSVFSEGDKVKVSAVSKGKGFQGVVKRHHFRGSPASHGHKSMLRRPGSIGQRFPQHTLKGLRMAGHMGHKRVTVKNLQIMKIDPSANIMAVKGAVPGRKGTLVEIVSL